MNRKDRVPLDAYKVAMKMSVIVTLALALALWPLKGLVWAGEFLFFALWNTFNIWLLGGLLTDIAILRNRKRAFIKGLCLVLTIANLPLFFALEEPMIGPFAAGFHLPYVVLVWNWARRI